MYRMSQRNRSVVSKRRSMSASQRRCAVADAGTVGKQVAATAGPAAALTGPYGILLLARPVSATLASACAFRALWRYGGLLGDICIILIIYNIS